MHICLSPTKVDGIILFYFFKCLFISLISFFRLSHSCAPNFTEDAIAMLEQTVHIPVLLLLLKQQ